MCIESNAARGDVVSVPDRSFVWRTANYYKTSATSVEIYTPGTYSASAQVDLTPSSSFFELGHTYRFSFVAVRSEASLTTGNVIYQSAFAKDLILSISDVQYNLGSPSNAGAEKSFEWVCDTTTARFAATWKVECVAHLGAGSSIKFGSQITFRDITVEDITPRSEKEILEDINKDTTETLEQAKEQTETQKGIFASIKEFFAGFFQNLIDSVIGLFVPSSDEMSDLFGQLNDFFSDTFGFLYAPFDYLIQLVGVFTSSTGTTGLTFPGFSIMGYEVWPDMTYDIASDPVAGKVLGYVRTGTGILLAGWFIMYLQDFFKERFGSGDG